MLRALWVSAATLVAVPACFAQVAARDVPFDQWERVADGGEAGPAAPAGADADETLRAGGIERTAIPGEIRLVLRDASGITWIATDRALVVCDGRRKPARLGPEQGLPLDDLRCLATDADAVWFGTPHGVVRFDGERWRVFAGRRWLPDDAVSSIRSDAGGVRVVTGQGACRLRTVRLTLGEKAERFEQVLLARHLRHGLVADSGLAAPGDTAHSRPHDSDNDGLWTGMYLAAECFRAAATKSEVARTCARNAFAAMERLCTVSGLPGFPARTVVTREEGHGGGEWHDSADGQWIWKGDTSSDEIVGHMFAYGLYYDLVAEGAERDRVRKVVSDMMGHIVEHGFNLVDVDGKPTTFGRWGPDYTLGLEGYFARGLQALEILSHLQVAIHVTGEARFREAYDRLVRKHGYARMTLVQKINVPTFVNHSDDELAFLSYYPLLRYETDPDLRKIYLRSLMSAWKIEQPEHGALWNFIAGSARGERGDPDAAASVEYLRDVPLDLVEWPSDNSSRRDAKLMPYKNRHRNAIFDRALPISERAVMRWNTDPYAVTEGGNGAGEAEPTFWLLPYWMGRYHGFLGAPEKE